MDSSEFPSNSQHKRVRVDPSKDHKQLPGLDVKEAPKKKVESVVKGEVITRKKPLGKRFFETFFGGDAKGVASHVMFDVMIPATKDMIADTVSQAVERALFGDVRTTTRRGRGFGTSSFTNYNRMSQSRGPIGGPREDPRDRERPLSRRARERHQFDEIILATRGEATEVLDQLVELVSAYDIATVADLYSLVGQTPSFTDERWGWDDLRGTDIVRTRHGYLLDLPRPSPVEA